MPRLPDPGRSGRPAGRFADLVWLVPAGLAVVAACVTARHLSVVLPLLVMALAPWLLLAAGRELPGWLLGTVGIVPVVGILVLDGLNGSVFLGTTTLCLLASRADRAVPLVGIAAAGVALPFTSLLGPRSFDPGSFYFAIGDLFGIAVGVLLGHTRRLDVQLREADVRLAAVAAQQQRTRLARDVHDLVAHSLTVAVLQIGGARGVLRTDPARAEQALDDAERVSRESLDAIREVVGLLRSGDDAPGPAVELTRLVETYRAAGVEIDVAGNEGTVDLPLLVRGTLYRVAQEALANAARYSGPGSPVVVRTVADDDGVTMTIVNQRSAAQRSPSGGYGLTGLQEQVSAVGGTLRCGPEREQWRVECRLPRRARRVGAEVTNR